MKKVPAGSKKYQILIQLSVRLAAVCIAIAVQLMIAAYEIWQRSIHIKDPRGKLVNSPIVKKINHSTGLIFENAKCIKCGSVCKSM